MLKVKICINIFINFHISALGKQLRDHYTVIDSIF